MSIKGFFKGKSIFITGGSGFIGKVLIEKLLRSCDGIEKIYILLRKKKDKAPEERLKAIFDCSLFNKLKKINPEAIKKLVPMCGDVSELKLGLSEEDIQTLTENVDIIYHGAASVRFDDHLKDSVVLNTRGTRELVEIALQAKKLITFVHISTIYCNCDKTYIEEKLYPPHADWRNTLMLIEQIDQHTLDVLSEKYIHPLPNTYTFAKSLAEHVVNDLCKGRLLTAIVRPSVVIATMVDPEPGWIDNFNGPMGLLCAGGKGILKTSYGDENTLIDFVPVDILVKTLLIIPYEKSISKDVNNVTVYNIAAGKDKQISNRQIIDLGARLTWDAPYNELFWYPSFSITNNWYMYYVTFLLYHMLPALLCDGLLKLMGKKSLLVKIQRKVYIANVALIYFMQNSFTFINEKCLALERHIMNSETETFTFLHCYQTTVEDVYTFYLKAKIATSEILFKEKFDRKKGFRNTLILWVMNFFLHTAIYGVICWCLITKIQILTIFGTIANDILQYLNTI